MLDQHSTDPLSQMLVGLGFFPVAIPELHLGVAVIDSVPGHRHRHSRQETLTR
jgi:hypothetical protein